MCDVALILRTISFLVVLISIFGFKTFSTFQNSKSKRHDTLPFRRKTPVYLVNNTPKLSESKIDVQNANHENKISQELDLCHHSPLSRKEFVALSLLTTGIILNSSPKIANAEVPRFSMEERLVWSSKKEKLKEGKNLTYNKLFITYLTRFILNYDIGEQGYWDLQARQIPLSKSAEEVAVLRRGQFAEFAEAVELGLLDFQGKAGAAALFSLLLSRYGETIERRRQIAIVFSLLQKPEQPTERMIELIASTDNATVTDVVVGDPGSGYCEERPPRVTIGPPVIGKERAEAKAVLRETGKIRKVKLLSSGCGYRQPPEVIFSEPADPTGVQATGRAVLDKHGSIKEIVITDPGRGYSNLFEPTVSIALPDDNSICGTLPEGKVLLDYEVGEVQVTYSGNGYAVALPVKVLIEPPEEPDGTKIEGKPARAAVFTARQQRAELKSLTGALPVPPTQTSVSAQLTKLLDSDVYFPEWDAGKRYFFLSGMEAFMNEETAESAFYDAAFLNPEYFGPIGRSPVEREKAVGLGGYLRLASSGALCTGLVRFLLHPIDLVKCRAQRFPEQYPNIIEGFKKCRQENILDRGLDLTTCVGFLIGITSFGLVEFFRRAFTTLAAEYSIQDASIPIILVSSGLATLVSDFVVIGFETIRIQAVTSPVSNYQGSLQYTKEWIRSKGIAPLFAGYFPLVSRDLPFTITKFLVYDLLQKLLLSTFPAAQEDPSLTLLISLAAGLVAGVTGAIVTTPPDNILTQLSNNEDSSDSTDWKDVVKKLLQNGGIANLFRGVGLRCFYFGSLISIQFFLYDYFKILFQVSPDDLELVLDVFADRLSFYY